MKGIHTYKQLICYSVIFKETRNILVEKVIINNQEKLWPRPSRVWTMYLITKIMLSNKACIKWRKLQTYIVFSVDIFRYIFKGVFRTIYHVDKGKLLLLTGFSLLRLHMDPVPL